jgi:hypothetical protein
VVATAPAGRVTAKHVDEVVESNRWPKPNSLGVFTMPAEIIFDSKDATAKILYLQVGPDEWVSDYAFAVGGSTRTSLPKETSRRWPSKQAAIFEAATGLVDSVKHRLNITAVDRGLAKNLFAWAGVVINSNAEKQEPLKLEAPKADKGNVSLASEWREALLKQLFERAHEAVVAIRSLQDLLMADATNSWLCTEAVNAIEKIEANIKRRGDQKAPATVKDIRGIAAGLTRSEQSTKDKAAAKAKLFVLCREPSKGAIGAAKKPRYDSGGGWTIDPKKAKTFTIAAATERARDYEVVVPVEKALRRFEKGL